MKIYTQDDLSGYSKKALLRTANELGVEFSEDVEIIQGKTIITNRANIVGKILHNNTLMFK